MKKLLVIFGLAALGLFLMPEVEGQIGYKYEASTVLPAAFPLLGTDGTAGAPTYSFTNDTDTGVFWPSSGNIGWSTNGTMILNLRATNQAGSGASIFTLNPTLLAMDNSDTIYGLHIDITNADHTGASNELSAIRIDTITPDAHASEYAIKIEAGWDQDIYDGDSLKFLAVASIANQMGATGAFSVNDGTNDLLVSNGNTDLLTITPDGTAANGTYTFEDIPAAGAGDDLIVFSATVLAMDNSDTISFLNLDITNADHGGSSNFLYALDIAAITGDAEASEYAIYMGDGWDNEIYFAGAVAQIVGAAVVNMQTPAAKVQLYSGDDAYYVQIGSNDGNVPGTVATGVLSVTGTQGAMSNNHDVQYIRLDINGSPNHAATSYLTGLYIDALPAIDTDAFESAIRIGEKWDSAITIEHMAAAPVDNPPSGWVSFFVDDNVDYSGGGGNDCALVARNSQGDVVLIATLELNAACP